MTATELHARAVVVRARCRAYTATTSRAAGPMIEDTEHLVSRRVRLYEREDMPFPRDALRPFRDTALAFRDWHAWLTLRWPLEDARLLPLADLQRYADGLAGWQERWDRHVTAFCEGYEHHLADIRASLGARFDRRRYPADPRGEFAFRVRFAPVPSAASFPARADAVARSLETEIERSYALGVRALRARVGRTLKSLMDQLWHGARWRRAQYRRLREQLTRAQRLNEFVQDDTLAAVCEALIPALAPGQTDTPGESQGLARLVESALQWIYVAEPTPPQNDNDDDDEDG